MKYKVTKKMPDGGILLPQVEITAKMPNWKKYSNDFESAFPKSERIQSYLDPFSRSLGNSETNYPQRIDDKYNQDSNDYIARALILDRNNDKYTDKERNIINSSQYRGKSKEDVYNNPLKLDISNYDNKVNFLYNNDYLTKLPVSRQILKNVAYDQVNDINTIAQGYKEAPDSSAVPSSHNKEKTDYESGRFNPLSQYLYNDQKLSESKYQPKNDYFTFMKSYSLKDKLNVNKKAIQFLNESLGMPAENLKKGPVYFDGEKQELPYDQHVDLGNYKSGAAWDNDKNLPYYFISDAWDFDPQDYIKRYNKGIDKERLKESYQQSYLMSKIGTPYKIYDRFYFDPKTGSYIDDSQLNKKKMANGGSINLLETPEQKLARYQAIYGITKGKKMVSDEALQYSLNQPLTKPNTKYTVPQVTKNTKAGIASASLLTSGIPIVNGLVNAAGVGGDLYTATRYLMDGQYKNAGEDYLQAGIGLIPTITGTLGLKGDSFLSTGQRAINGLINTAQKASDIETMNEMENGGKMKYTVKLKDGGSLSPNKAKKMLHDKSYTTDKQRKYFGYVAGKADYGAQLNGINNLQVEGDQYKHLSPNMIELGGQPHSNGGTDIQYGDQQVEAEKGETVTTDQQGALHVLGNLVIPGTNTKFKSAGKELGKQEQKVVKQQSKATTLINANNPYDSYDRLAFNSGNLMQKGAQSKQQQLAQTREGLVKLQEQMLQTADQMGVKPKDLYKAKYGKKLMQDGGPTNPPKKAKIYDPAYLNNMLGNTQIVRPYMSEPTLLASQPTQPEEIPSGYKGTGTSVAVSHNNPGNIKYAPFLDKYGAVPGKPGTDGGQFAQFPTLAAGQAALSNLLFKGKNYKNLTVQQAASRWTGGHPYGTIPQSIANKKVSDLNQGEQLLALNAFTQGEDSKTYNWDGLTPDAPSNPSKPWNPIDLQPLPTRQATQPSNPSIGLEHLPSNVQSYTDAPQTPYYDTPSTPLKRKNQGLPLGEIAPELYTLATERPDFVPTQRYNPELYQPYQVSFQDRINQNQADFNAISSQLTNNPEALSSLAAKKYEANNGVLADEFRTNQGITNDVNNKNVSLLNDSQIRNLELNDQQFTRQEQARVNTRTNIRAALNSIGSKYQQNRLENQQYNALSYLHPQYDFDQSGNKIFTPDPNLTFGDQLPQGSGNAYQRSRVTTDKNGNTKSTIITTPSQAEQARLNYQNQKYQEDWRDRKRKGF